MNYNGLKVLVTGADGFIGSHLTEALVRAGAEVTALSLYNSFDMHGWLDDLEASVLRNLRLVRGDVRDAALVRRIVAGQDVVFHLAALIAIPHSYEAPQSYVDTNVIGTLNVLEACRESQARRVVHTSTSEVYGSAIVVPITEDHPLQGQSPYSASKIGADMMAAAFSRSFDVPVAILRPFNTFGPRQSERAVIGSTIRQILDPTCRTLQLGLLDAVRDFTFVDDTVGAFLAIGSAPGIQFGSPYNAGSGKAVTVSELVNLLCEITACAKRTEHDLVRLRPAKSEVMALLADSRRLEADSGWRPTIVFRDGLERTVAWWEKRFHNGKVRSATTYMM
jgi:NAD dependent epimerase/dehydratase